MWNLCDLKSPGAGRNPILFEREFAGLTRVEIQCSPEESYNLFNSAWGYQVSSSFSNISNSNSYNCRF